MSKKNDEIIEANVNNEEEVVEKMGLFAKGKNFVKNHKKAVIAGAVLGGLGLASKVFKSKKNSNTTSDVQEYDVDDYNEVDE